jgi:predicted Fe-Mo cluster-binding NifX family protein
MIVAIPVADGTLCAHFGHCQTFALVTVDDNKKNIGNIEYLVPPPHEPGVLPKWLHERGANVIVAGGMGTRAQQFFEQFGITVVVGAPSQPPEKIAALWLRGELVTGENVCDH